MRQQKHQNEYEKVKNKNSLYSINVLHLYLVIVCNVFTLFWIINNQNICIRIQVIFYAHNEKYKIVYKLTF